VANKDAEVQEMGYSFKRLDKKGRERWTACYQNVKGRVVSAGTCGSEKQADRKWQRAEDRLADGRIGDPRRGRIAFERYVEDTWLPHHVMEPSTREGYTYSIRKHITPEFGTMRMIDIMPEHVREWITILQDNGVSHATIKKNKMILSVIFTTALNDQVVFMHPCRGVKTPTVPVKSYPIITPEQFDMIYQALPDAETQLLIEADIESGLRWGELTELRVKDLNFQTHILTVSRAVVDLNRKFHPHGERFLVKEYPKNKKHRQMKLSAQIVDKLQAHRDTRHLGRDDLLFAIRDQENKKPVVRVIPPNHDELGLTSPNDKGRQYKHGTTSGYGAGKCRCEHCRSACAIYRAQRRAQGKDNPRTPRTLDTDGHIPNDWFRNQAWNPATKRAGLENGIRVHDLRHAHASWLLAGGADLQVVKERMGHGSITTTERYLHTLPETADKTALTALSNIRYRSHAYRVQPPGVASG
jgi:integrase